MDNEILNEIISMVLRARTLPHSELEIRLGHIVTQGPSTYFETGFKDGILSTIRRLNNRLGESCNRFPHWARYEQHNLLRAWYPNDLRQTCMPVRVATAPTHPKVLTLPPMPQYQQKLKCAVLDLATNRNIDVRFALSQEIPMDNDVASRKIIQGTQPIAVQLVRRASFQETIPMGSDCIRLRYDVTKMSARAPNKLECTKTPCEYAIELEVEKWCAFYPDDEAVTRKQNEFIAQCLITRASDLLGKYDVASSSPLPSIQWRLAGKKSLR